MLNDYWSASFFIYIYVQKSTYVNRYKYTVYVHVPTSQSIAQSRIDYRLFYIELHCGFREAKYVCYIRDTYISFFTTFVRLFNTSWHMSQVTSKGIKETDFQNGPPE
jgi:hypothetical protein